MTFRTNPELFKLFFTAESLGKTVDELLSGHPKPVTTTELRYWDAYRKVKYDIQQELSDQAQASSSSDNPGEKTYVTMGQ